MFMPRFAVKQSVLCELALTGVVKPACFASQEWGTAGFFGFRALAGGGKSFSQKLLSRGGTDTESRNNRRTFLESHFRKDFSIVVDGSAHQNIMGQNASRSKANGSLFDFTAFFLLGELPETSRPPETWDELLDWADDAAVILCRLIQEQRQLRGIHFKPKESVLFVPYVLSKDCAKVDNLCSMSWLERTIFFAQSVRF
jgi:hypothetical protein